MSNYNIERESIIVEFSVIMANIDPQEEAPYVDYIKIQSVDRALLEQHLKSGISHFWGLKVEDGVMHPVDLALPLPKNLKLDGFATMNKANKIFREAGDADHYEFGKAHIVKSLAVIFPEPIIEGAA